MGSERKEETKRRDEENEHHIELINLRTERLKNLEIVQARYGIDTKSEVLTEIIKLRKEIDESKRIIAINRKYINETYGMKNTIIDSTKASDPYQSPRYPRINIKFAIGSIVTLSIVCILGLYSFYRSTLPTSEPSPTAMIPTTVAEVTPKSNNPSPPTVALPPYDNSPTIPPENTLTCAVYSYGSYFPALQIVQQGLDKQNGFHLKLITLGLAPYDKIPIDTHDDKIKSGEWDCFLDTLDGPAKNGNYGVITAIIDESAGADQIWASANIKTLNDLAGKRISFVEGSASEFLLLASLNTAGLHKNDIISIQAQDVDDAITKFNQGEADVVVGWEPNTASISRIGVHKLIDTSELRYLIDIIVISQQAIDTKPDMVQRFHSAWFQALKIQFDDFSNAAQSIADWGNNDWTTIHTDRAVADLSLLLTHIAQAGYGPNLIVMQNPKTLYDRLRHARSVWALANDTLPPLDIETAVDPRFILGLKGDTSIIPQGLPRNNSFVMSGQPPYPTIQGGKPVAILPCEKFEFLPDSDVLSESSQKTLDECVLPVLKASTLYLRIIGSSAWPGPLGRFTEDAITDLARRRAVTVAQYLANRIDPNRLLIDFTLPPQERREILEESELEKDRFVRLELVTAGR